MANNAGGFSLLFSNDMSTDCVEIKKDFPAA